MTTAKMPTSTDETPLFTTDYHIYINHTDAGGIVYHANHLVFFENCRRDWFTKIGVNGYFLQADDGQIQHFVVSQAQLQYRKAIFLDEVISVQIDKIELKPASIVFYQSIHRQSTTKNKASDTVLSHAKIVIACVQNQVISEVADQHCADNNHNLPDSNSADSMRNAASIRPIRVPKTLHALLQKALTNSENNT